MTRLLASLFLALGANAAFADDEPAKKKTDVDATVEKGLEWLKRNQEADGHWAAQGGQYPTTMTALAGMCFLMEGSTLREGKYSDQLLKAVDWIMKRAQPNGLLGNPNNPTEASRYMYGHGFALHLPGIGLRRRGRGGPPQEARSDSQERGRFRLQGPDGQGRLGLRQRRGGGQFRRGLRDRHADAGDPRRPERRHSGAEGEHR